MTTLHTLTYRGTAPQIGAPAHVGAGAAVLGRATIGAGARLGAGSVIRADGHYVRIGRDFRLGARGTVHIAHDLYPTHVGDGVSAGAGAVIHACDVGDRAWLGDGAIVLDGATVEAGAALAPGAVVFPRGRAQSGWWHEGAPAKPLRPLEPGELEALHAAARAAADGEAPAPGAARGAEGAMFVARGAVLRGRITCCAEVGIWYGCVLDAGAQSIAIGDRANIQDNTVLIARDGPVAVGAGSTLGHNVTATDAQVGAGALVGIGAVLAPGTVVADGAFVAAGARTEPGQHVEGGWLHGGVPCRPLKPLDAPKTALIAATVEMYVGYARDFAAAQAGKG